MVNYLQKELETTPQILVRCTSVTVQAILFDNMESRGHVCRHFSCHPEQGDQDQDRDQNQPLVIFAMESEPMAWEWKGRIVTQKELFLN